MSKEQELLDKIEKTKKNTAIPEKLKASMIAAFEKQLEKETPAPGPKRAPKKGTATDIYIFDGKEITGRELVSAATLENQPGMIVSPEDAIRFFGKNRVSKKGKKTHGRQKSTEPKEKTKATYKYKGKNLEDLSDEDCEEAVRESKERREKAAKAEKKSKRRPVMEKVTANVAQAVKQVIENIPAADIKDAPKTELKKIDRVVSAAKALVKEFKSILGDDFDKDTINDEFKEIHALAKELHRKYGD